MLVVVVVLVDEMLNVCRRGVSKCFHMEVLRHRGYIARLVYRRYCESDL